MPAKAPALRAAALTAITYAYFLIFAQFAFLGRLRALGLADDHLKAVMAAMAAGGILTSLLAPRWEGRARGETRLRAGLAISALAALLSILPLGTVAAPAVALLIGAGVGLLTTTLATHLGDWAGGQALLAIGLGTGAGYLAANLPPLFNAPPAQQAAVAAALCIAGLFLPLGSSAVPAPAPLSLRSRVPFPFVLASLTALVWLDSAAFFIIQNTPALKAGTWQGSRHLWANGILHLLAALASARILARKGICPVLAASFLLLGSACMLLLEPARAGEASLLYPVGVSLYSVALVAYPSLASSGLSPRERGKRAGLIYAVAGWAGSALGIGMGQNLGHVPPAFVGAAGLVVLLPGVVSVLRYRARELGLTALVLGAALLLDRRLEPGPDRRPAGEALSAVERGRLVYISEGCIHCHSQYVRPGTADVLLWGPVTPLEEVRAGAPPLIGNRRQGPDLSQVGGRRSPLWLEAHFYSPAGVSGASIMPPYGFLFRDGRGQDLVAYLESLRAPDLSAHLEQERAWRPSPRAQAEASAAEGERLFRQDCAGCHSPEGRTRMAWAGRFREVPADLPRGPWRYVSVSEPREQLLGDLARITKFGIAGTDMAGHEYLPDREIASLGIWMVEAGSRIPDQTRNTDSTQEKKP